jgi:hypothetical protein
MATTNFAEAIGNVILRQIDGTLGNAQVFIMTKSDFYREALVVVEYESGSKLTVGVIQRTEGAECESHT